MILVVGVTGSLGGRITRGLLAQGKAVRILARNYPISAELAKQGRANTAAPLPVNYLPLRSAVPLLPPEVGNLLNGMEIFEIFLDMTETEPANGASS